MPVVFVSHDRVKEGRLDDFKRFYRAGVGSLEAAKPGTVAFLAYVSEEDVVTIFHVFPDAEAMDRHFEGAAERSKAAYEFIESARFEVYGEASPAALQMLERTGMPVTAAPDHIGGFLRLRPR